MENTMPTVDLDDELIYVSRGEYEMILALRQEEQMIINEQNEKSSTQQAVEDIYKLNVHLKANGINFESDPVDNVIKCLEHRLKLLAEVRTELEDFHRNRFDINFYQQHASKTAIYPGKGTPLGLIYCALKLTGEAGEVSENVGKALRDDSLIDTSIIPEVSFNNLTKERANKLVLELGDVLWYISQCAKELGFTLEEIAQANLDKLASRQERGKLQGSGDER